MFEGLKRKVELVPVDVAVWLLRRYARKALAVELDEYSEAEIVVALQRLAFEAGGGKVTAQGVLSPVLERARGKKERRGLLG